MTTDLTRTARSEEGRPEEGRSGGERPRFENGSRAEGGLVSESGDGRADGGRTTRGRSKSTNKRELLIEAAIAEFARRGYANTEVQAVTDHCSLAKGTLYLYFKSKENLFWEAFLHISREIERIIQKVSLAETGPIEKIRDCMVQAAELFVANPDFISVISQTRSVPRDRVPAEVTRLTENTIFTPLYGFIQAAIDQKLILPQKVQDYTDSILNAIWGVIMFYRANEDSMTLPERVRFTVELFFNGMMKR